VAGPAADAAPLLPQPAAAGALAALVHPFPKDRQAAGHPLAAAGHPDGDATGELRAGPRAGADLSPLRSEPASRHRGHSSARQRPCQRPGGARALLAEQYCAGPHPRGSTAGPGVSAGRAHFFRLCIGGSPVERRGQRPHGGEPRHSPRADDVV